MKPLTERLKKIEIHVKNNDIRVMIMGLGSVGTYLLDYFVSMNDSSIHIIVVGRTYDKMEQNVNIVRIAGLIRGVNKSSIEIWQKLIYFNKFRF